MRIATLMLSSSILLGGCASTPCVNFQDVSCPPIHPASSAYLGDRLMMQARAHEGDPRNQSGNRVRGAEELQ